MKILIITLYFAPDLTGIAKIMGETANWLASHGHQVRVITAPPHYPEWRLRPGTGRSWYKREPLSEAGGLVWRCPIWVPRRPTGLARLLYLLSFALCSAPVVLGQAGWRPDLVMLVEPPLLCAPAALAAAWMGGSLSWLNIKDYEVDAAFALGLLPGGLRRVAEGIESWWMRRFERVSSISKAMVARAQGKGVSPDRLVLFRDFVDLAAIRDDPEASSRLRREFGIPPDKLVILYSGNLGQKQGLELVTEAARRLENDERILFLICGEGGAKRELLRQADGLRNLRVRGLVPASDLNALLHIADIHLLPQRIEAADLVMPSKLLYMLASRRPILATAEPGTEVGEVVRECGGVLVPPGDAGALAGAVERLCAMPAGRDAAGLQGRAFAEKHFDRDAVMTAFIDMLAPSPGAPAKLPPAGQRSYPDRRA